MRQIAMMLAAVGILCLAATAAEAHGYYHHGYGYGYRYAPVYGYPVPLPAQPRVLMGTVLTRPTMLVQPPPRTWYRPAPCYRYYAPVPRYNLYYRSRGLSLGIGF